MIRQVTCDGSVPERARATVPWPIHIAESTIEGAGLGSFTFVYLPKGIHVGSIQIMMRY